MSLRVSTLACLFALGSGLAALPAAASPGKAGAQPVTAETTAAGVDVPKLYEQHCAACHAMGVAGAPIAGYDRHSIREPLASLFYDARYPVSRLEHAITRTLKAGQIELQGNLSIQVREFGEIDTLPTDRYYDESITWLEKKITPNDKPTLLMWMAEGTCLITIGKTVNESSDCPTQPDSQWKLKSQPTTESWIEVKINKSKGWVKVDGQQVEEVSRSF